MSETIVNHSGWLTKQGAFVRSWKRRWFVQRGATISYFRNQGDSEPAGVIDLESCQVHHATRKTGKRNALELVTADRNFYMYADSSEEMEQWIKSINEVRSLSSSADSVATPTLQLHVKGMMCERCSHHVKRALLKSPGVDEVAVDHEEETVMITGKPDVSEILARLEEAGFVPSVS
eukprot:TRINITY_DN2326_c0_g1_i4.p1 TRINITY_DN2326_c0_g1~~TRINITY_DN2326_c0_g1_i4.p1  ORF type:complete len:177 (-),score=54.07 TRINITY_DN2326_c0_g1_i4:299-829(-)